MRGGQRAMEALADISKKLSKAKVVRVGFLSGATYPDGTPVALIAAIQDSGAPAAGIPPRSFFRNMIADKKAGWPAALAANLKAVDYDGAQALDRMGQGIAGQLRQSIIDTNTPPLKPATIKRKGSSKPLVDSRQMLGSVSHEVVGK